MMKRAILPAILCVLIALSSVPTTDAEVFKLGTKIKDSDFDNNFLFSSGAHVQVIQEGPSNIQVDPSNYTAIFDCDLNTGINLTISPLIRYYYIYVHLPQPVHVTNISIYPYYEGLATNYTLQTLSDGVAWSSFPYYVDNQRTIDINFTVDVVVMKFEPLLSGRLSFNDIFVRYIPVPGVNDTFLNLYNELMLSIEALNSTISNLTKEVDLLLEKHKVLEKKLNGTGNALKLAEENITELQELYDELNQTLSNITTQLAQLNSVTGLDLGGVGEELTQIQSDMALLDQSLNDLRSGSGGMEEVVGQMDETTKDLDKLNNNVTALAEDMGEGFNDTTPGERVLQLESENIVLQSEVDELTGDMDELEAEVEDLTTELQAQKEAQDEDATTLDTSEVLLILVPTILVLVIMAAIMIVIFRRSMRKQMSDLRESIQPSTNEGHMHKSPMSPGIEGHSTLKPTPVPVPEGVSLTDTPAPLLLPSPSSSSSPRVRSHGGSTMKADFNDWLTSDTEVHSQAEMLNLLEIKHKEGAVSEEIYTYLADEIKGMG